MKFNVLSVTPEEYEKANKDWSYAPKEYVAGTIEAATESEARAKLKRAIASGKFSIGSDIQL